MIWKKETTIKDLNSVCENTLISHIDIKITEIGEDFIKATMPVSHKTLQPIGLLHGGANCVLAESLGSIAANLVIDENHYAIGLNISTHHLKSSRSGNVSGIAKPIHLGRSTQLWNIDTFNDLEQKTSSTRLEMMILKK